MSPKVFIDSDVVISSLISRKGAAHLLLNSKNLEYFVSNLSIKELKIVTDRLDIDRLSLKNLIKNRFKLIELKETAKELKDKFNDYVSDVNDAHIIGGACEAGVKFLISYNIKDFNVDKIKKDFDIIVITPANFLQYLRSLS